MPAVNLPLQETHGNSALYAVPGTQLRLLSGVALTFLALVSLGVALLLLLLRLLRVLRGRGYNKAPLPTYTGKLLPDAGPTTLQHQQQQQQQQHTRWISEKSRGTAFYSNIMSVNQPSGISQLRAAEKLGEGKKKRRQKDGSKERAQGEVLEEEMEGERMTAPVGYDAGMPPALRSGPPPPLPLTPPVLSAGVFAFQDRRLSVAASSMGDLDTSFFHQPNPDYTLSPSPGSMSTALPHDQDSPSIPRRRSYAKVLPLGPSHADADHGEHSFPPSSFPSSSPILPLAPHESLDPAHEIDVKGEIISVVDDSGAGWKRHTRVYGGGVCLACLASGSQGGFYGDNVPPEHRR